MDATLTPRAQLLRELRLITGAIQRRQAKESETASIQERISHGFHTVARFPSPRFFCTCSSCFSSGSLVTSADSTEHGRHLRTELNVLLTDLSPCFRPAKSFAARRTSCFVFFLFLTCTFSAPQPRRGTQFIHTEMEIRPWTKTVFTVTKNIITQCLRIFLDLPTH